MDIPELWEQILLDTDPEDLPNICFQNSTLYQVCNDPRFWRIIFEREQLPILRTPTNFREWLTEYQYLKGLPIQVEEIMNRPEFEIVISNEIFDLLPGQILGMLNLSSMRELSLKKRIERRILPPLPGRPPRPPSTTYYYRDRNDGGTHIVLRPIPENIVREILTIALLHKIPMKENV